MAGGQPRLLQHPDQIKELFDGYRDLLKANPRIKVEFVGKDATRVEIPLQVPLTMEGFNVYCYEKVGVLRRYFDNADGRFDEYVQICTYVREQIRADQIEGGMVGQYNSSITQRLNGLTEKTQTELTGNLPTSVTFNFTDMSGDKTDEGEE